MEQKKSYPPLPSNYVTLAQLQERWLKQQNQINQPQQQDHQQKDQQQQTVAAAPENVTASTSRNHAKRYRPKNRNDSGTNRSKSELGAGIGDVNANLDGKVGESKKKKKKKKQGGWKAKRKPKVEEKGASEEGAATQGNEKAKKTTTESKLNGNSVKVEEVEAKKTTIESKLNGDSVRVEEVEAKKTTIESDLHGNAVRVEEVEQKFGGLSVEDSGKGKQNGRVRRMNNGFRHSQSQRNCHGGYGYGYGGFSGERSKVRMQRSEKMVWVRKDGRVNGIET